MDYSYGYTGAAEIFVSPYDGVYKIELWGGSSAGFNSGAYVCGEISLTAGEKLFIYVGQKGVNEILDPGKTIFNGGGPLGHVKGRPAGVSMWQGAGATDVRLISGDWDDMPSLQSRLIIAAGAGGWSCSKVEGYAGGLTGYDGKDSEYSGFYCFGGKGGSQTSGGAGSAFDRRAIRDYGISAGAPGRLGSGGRGGEGRFHPNYYYGGQGGGGGYFGGGGASGGGFMTNAYTAGGGGSSFISGHAGCIALASDKGPKSMNSTKITKSTSLTASIHPSGKYFVNTVMIDGAGYAWTDVRGERTPMPNPAGGEYALGLGHKDDGFARITLQRKAFDVPIIVIRDNKSYIAYLKSRLNLWRADKYE
jgi:hypothetical protein